VGFLSSGGKRPAPSSWPEWERFIVDVMKAATADELSSVEAVIQLDKDGGEVVDEWTGTPLTAVLHGADSGDSATYGDWRANFQTCLSRWLKILLSNGVDLEDYGKPEQMIYQRPETRRSQCMTNAWRLGGLSQCGIGDQWDELLAR